MALYVLSLLIIIDIIYINSQSLNWLSSCRFREDSTLSLMNNFNNNLYGQNLASSEIIAQISSHINKEIRNKPLILSFHGHTGTGKTYTTRLITESIYTERAQLKYVIRLSGGRYTDINKLEIYVGLLEKIFENTIKSCSKSLIIIDEVHLMASGLLDRLRHYFDYDANVDGVNYSNAIFIFISNIGATLLNNIALTNGTNDLNYTTVSTKLRENLLQISKKAFTSNSNVFSGIPFDMLVRESFVRYIPFFPLFSSSVSMCFSSQLFSYLNYLKNDYKIGAYHASSISPQSPVTVWLASKLHYEHGISVTGCKQVSETISSSVEYIISKNNLLLNNEYIPPVKLLNWYIVKPRYTLSDKIIQLDLPANLDDDYVSLVVINQDINGSTKKDL